MRVTVPTLVRIGALASLLALSCKSSPPATNDDKPAATRAAPAANAIVEKQNAAPAQWQNLMPDEKLTGFKRVPLDPLADKAVWQVKDGMLIIDGVGAKEMLLYEKELTDGVLRVEWRFLPATGDKPVYNGGVYVRTPLDGKSWVQLQVAHVDKPPIIGDLIAQVPTSSERINVFQTAASPGKPVGEWNTYEVTAHGKSIDLHVNGQHTVTWSECPLPSGHVGLQAEGAVIEVRKLEYGAL
jgi:hypothetical protein